jgi:hypothetical protein
MFSTAKKAFIINLFLFRTLYQDIKKPGAYQLNSLYKNLIQIPIKICEHVVSFVLFNY